MTAQLISDQKFGVYRVSTLALFDENSQSSCDGKLAIPERCVTFIFDESNKLLKTDLNEVKFFGAPKGSISGSPHLLQFQRYDG